MSAMSELDLVQREEWEAFAAGIQPDEPMPCENCDGAGECEDEYEGQQVRWACIDCNGTGVAQPTRKEF